MLTIGKYHKNDHNNFVDLIDECFWLQSQKKYDLVHWKFHTQLFSHKNRIICAYDEWKIVWQYSNIAYNFSKGDASIEWYLCQDMCVSKSHRRQWLITKMSTKLYDSIDKKTFTIWFSNSQWVKVDKNSNGYWYNVIDNLTSFYFPAIYKKEWYSFREIKSTSDFDTINFQDFNLFKKLLCFTKMKKYIKWRYLDKPEANYSMYHIQKDNKSVWFCIFKYVNKIATLYDFNCVKTVNTKKLMYTFKNICFNERYFIFRIIVLENLFWKDIFKWFLNIKKKEEIYFTVKKHNNFDSFDILEKEKWGIIWGDIL